MKRWSLIVISGLFLLWIALHVILHRPVRDGGILVSHRGAAGLAPENTLQAIRAGIETGAQRIEIDVQRSADGVLVLHHDEDIPDHGAVADLPYETIRAAGVEGEPIPTLEEALDLFAAESRLEQFLIIEGKSPDKYPGIARQILDAVDTRDLGARVIIMSFDQDFLREVHQIAPAVLVGSIHVYPFTVPNIETMDSVGVFWGSAVIDPTLIARLHRRGIDVNLWTIDSPLLARLMRWLGADAITTNRPDRLQLRGARH